MQNCISKFKKLKLRVLLRLNEFSILIVAYEIRLYLVHSSKLNVLWRIVVGDFYYL